MKTPLLVSSESASMSQGNEKSVVHVEWCERREEAEEGPSNAYGGKYSMSLA